MIDTVRIALFSIPVPEYDRDRVQSSSRVNNGASSYVLKSSKEKGAYAPSVRVLSHPLKTKIGYVSTQYLVIEVSVPKFLFGTSVHEASESDLPLFVKGLKNFLELDHNIQATEEDILKASVKRVDYAKNLILPITAESFFSGIEHCTWKSGRSMSKCTLREYSNKGREIIWRGAESSFYFYDKFKECIRDIENNLKNSLKDFLQKNSLIRVELRLMGKRLKRRLSKDLKGNPLTLENIWKEEISKGLLSEDLNEIVGIEAFLEEQRIQEVPNAINLQGKQAYILESLIRDSYATNLATAINRFRGQCSANTFQKYKKLLIQSLNIPSENLILNMIRDQISQMEPIQNKIYAFNQKKI